MTALLEIDALTKKFGGLVAVNEFSTRLEAGEICALIGPNGSGKTTIFNLITGIYRPTGGSIQYDGEEIGGERPDRIAKRGIARTFQNIRLFEGLDVLDNVLVGYHLRLKADPFSAVLRLPGYIREEHMMVAQARELLEALELDHLIHEDATSLPYGQQRKLEIARALATKPRLLLLDEPAAGMNPEETEDLMRFILHILQTFKLTIFLIEHQMRVVMGICPRIIVIDHGEIIAEGPPEAIQTNQRVVEAYLGAAENA